VADMPFKMVETTLYRQIRKLSDLLPDQWAQQTIDALEECMRLARQTELCKKVACDLRNRLTALEERTGVKG